MQLTVAGGFLNMNGSIDFSRSPRFHSVPRTAALILVLVMLGQPVFLVAANAQRRAQSGAKKQLALTEDQHIAHVLSRLTFGARPGDFERVKAMGVDAFINQQLDPDSLDVSGLISRLKMSAMQSATQMDAKKEEAGRMPALVDNMKAPDAMTKPVEPQNNSVAP